MSRALIAVGLFAGQSWADSTVSRVEAERIVRELSGKLAVVGCCPSSEYRLVQIRDVVMEADGSKYYTLWIAFDLLFQLKIDGSKAQAVTDCGGPGWRADLVDEAYDSQTDRPGREHMLPDATWPLGPNGVVPLKGQPSPKWKVPPALVAEANRCAARVREARRAAEPMVERVRKRYLEINGRTDLRAVNRVDDTGEFGEIHATGFFDGPRLVKLVTAYPMSFVTTEHYFDADGSLIFTFETGNPCGDDCTYECRVYFEAGQPVLKRGDCSAESASSEKGASAAALVSWTNDSKEAEGVEAVVRQIRKLYENPRSKKVTASTSSRSGEWASEYLFDARGHLVFAMRKLTAFSGARVEHRFYFDAGKMIRWINSSGERVGASHPRWTTIESEVFGAARRARAGDAGTLQ